MFSRILVINIFLAGVAVFFGLKTYGVWFPKTEKAKGDRDVQGRSAPPAKTVKPRRTPPESAYRVVVDGNLFSPGRVEVKPEEPEPEVEEDIKPLEEVSGRKITLYGVIIMDGYKAAIINNPVPKPGERGQERVMIGDKLDDYELVAIHKDRILLTKGSEKYEIPLYDKKNPKQRTFTKKDAKPKIITSEPARIVTESNVSKKKKPLEGEYEIVRTPFGNIKRRKK